MIRIWTENNYLHDDIFFTFNSIIYNPYTGRNEQFNFYTAFFQRGEALDYTFRPTRFPQGGEIHIVSISKINDVIVNTGRPYIHETTGNIYLPMIDTIEA